MRIDHLGLIAYGPFKDVSLDFSEGSYGLHLVYGLNEAGKSSALRALHSLLYGFPHSTPDAFLHATTKLRVGATLRDENGDVLKVVRRKGREKTLRGEDDKSLVDEGQLQALLQGIEQSLFESMFGIGYDALVTGGREIVQGGGDIGQLIFSASSGIANLQTTKQRLESAAEDLFKPRGSTQVVSKLLKEYGQKSKELRNAFLSGQEWTQVKQALDKAVAKKADVVERLNEAKRQQGRYERILAALKYVAERKELLEDLAQVEHAPDLRDDFSEERREVERHISNYQTEHKQHADRITRLKEAIGAIEINERLIGHADDVSQRFQDSGDIKQAQSDRIGVKSEAEAVFAEAKVIFADLGVAITIDQADSLRIERSVSRRIRELISEYTSISTKIKESGKRLPEMEQEIGRLKKSLEELPQPRPVEGLELVNREVGEVVYQEQSLGDAQREIVSTENSIALTQHRLGLSGFGCEDLSSLSIPSPEKIRVFGERLADVEKRQEKLVEFKASVVDRLSEVNRELEEIRLAGEVPTEDDLRVVRELRDKGWSLIVDLLVEAEPQQSEVEAFIKNFPEAKDVAVAFGEAMQDADSISDRLRRETERVISRARLLAEKRVLENKQRTSFVDEQSLSEEMDAIRIKWHSLWSRLGIIVDNPQEMLNWERDFQATVEAIRLFVDRCAAVKAIEEKVAQARGRLASCLGPFGVTCSLDDTLGNLAARVEVLLESEKILREKREKLEEQIKAKEGERDFSKRDLDLAKKEMGEWSEAWEVTISSIGLPKDWPPARVQDYVESLQKFFNKIKEHGELQKRIDGMDRRAEQFKVDVGAIVAAVAPEMSDKPALEVVRELNSYIQAQKEAKSTKTTYEKELRQEEKALEAVGTLLDQSKSALESLCKEANCESIEDLNEIERLSINKKSMQQQIKSVEDELRNFSAGKVIEDFVAEVVAEESDLLQPKIDELSSDIEILGKEQSYLDQEIGAKRSELALMDGISAAAVLSEGIQSILGKIEESVEEYARLKVATKILVLATERYRAKNEDPILTRASDLFSRITDNAFLGIRPDFDESGNPVLLGVRNEDEVGVRIEEMSDGTADQLYLALRLAGLENHLRTGDPLPFVVDDVLIKFDDERAKATLEVLAEISDKTQVIFFTHHQHLMELSREVVPSEKLFNHVLSH